MHSGAPVLYFNTNVNIPIVRFEGCDETKFGGQWVAAKDLREGMKVLLSNGSCGIINSIEVKHLDEPETTYNFEVSTSLLLLLHSNSSNDVDDLHNYYVGSEGILVHNDCYIDELFVDPSKLGKTTPEELYNYLNNNGYNPQPLSQSSTIKNVPFSEGGGFKATFGGDKMIYYHPATGSHHIEAYYKISSGSGGTKWVDLLGNIFKTKGGI